MKKGKKRRNPLAGIKQTVRIEDIERFHHLTTGMFHLLQWAYPGGIPPDLFARKGKKPSKHRKTKEVAGGDR